MNSTGPGAGKIFFDYFPAADLWFQSTRPPEGGVLKELCERRMDTATTELIVFVTRVSFRTVVGTPTGFEGPGRWSTSQVRHRLLHVERGRGKDLTKDSSLNS